MNRKPLIQDLLTEMKGSEIADEYLLKITFWIGDDKFAVLPEDFQEFRECCPDRARNFKYYINVRKIVDDVNTQMAIIYACAMIESPS